MEATPLPPPLWVSFVPLLTLVIPFLITASFLARRKGKSLLVHLLLALVPGVNLIATVWLASLTDASVMSDMAEMKKRLDAKA